MILSMPLFFLFSHALAQNMDQQQVLVNVVPQNVGNNSTSWGITSFSGSTHLHGVTICSLPIIKGSILTPALTIKGISVSTSVGGKGHYFE